MALVRSSIVATLVGLWMISCLAAAEKGGNVPAMFVFGDSLADASHVSIYLALPFSPPHLEPKANSSAGINFASAGSGLLDSTGAKERLYRAGARKLVVVDLPALGCDPFCRVINDGDCMGTINLLFVAYNTGLKSHVAHLSQKLPGLTIIQFKAYDYLMNIIQNGEAYGFKDTKSACCGLGLLYAQVPRGMTTTKDLFCNDTNACVLG
ncbi:GDSL esterase/lipase At2g23540-like [Cryptomeria japonica]|uniref:GDSL esterase/lipase At2g23540-like n=1 Tax=Cryptomeria japonica TaxID=3369 RepID=UPI0025AD3631|nr:GDSL esterase/lipase At2g23540-like [Cryptomeria japonica]